MDYEQTLVDLTEAMLEPKLSAEEQMELRVESIISELDELVRFTANAETFDLVYGQRVAIGQMVTRAQLIASFINLQNPKLRVVSHG